MLMWHFRLCNVQDVAVFLSITLYLCHLAEAISIYSPQRSLTSSRVRLYENGSMSLSHLRLQDGGFYVVTVTDSTGSSKDAGFVLKVNEVLYEDLQYLSVAAVALAFCAGLLMLAMWLLHKACRKIRARRRKKQMPENDATELQPL
ncbi:V-set and transmembrane domain-containing protein 5 isoform X2 [Melanotaenia boesemani]|uniref:V-set and transmembrane domain-containing protein 5 isoform X2 n=1 Tax=Melanotaenia boesemani TaxID=1250792 RepID=UPI001C05AA4C|nr:V-set and transmembrane domain-containing protein 5 isoform X2 [Melanotaenia boesemani]